MAVKRISNLNIQQRGLFTALYGNHEDFFVDADLKKYNLWQQLYLYLKSEGYDIVLFYDANNNFHSHRQADLIKFLNLQAEVQKATGIKQQKVYNASHIRSPLRKATVATPAPEQPGLNEMANNQHYIYDSPLHSDDGFYKLRGLAQVYEFVSAILRDVTKKSAIIIKSPAYSFFENQQSYATLFENIKDDYDRHGLRNRVIIAYECSDANAMNFHFHAYHQMLFSSPYFHNVFMEVQQEPVKIKEETAFYIDRPDQSEIRNILNSFRLKSRLPSVFTDYDKISSGLFNKRSSTREISTQLNRASLKNLSLVSLIDAKLIIPPNIELDDNKLLSNLNKVIGQSEISTLILRKLNGHFKLRKRERPMSFLFIGTSGVGKTFTAEQIGASLETSGYAYVSLMMTEYQQEQDAYKLIGSPPGYVGSDTKPRLFDELDKSPRLVILFDEIEKAHEKVITTLMQLLDKGKLSWNEREGDFRDCILVFTSNAERDKVVALKNQHLKNNKGPIVNALLDAGFQKRLKDVLVQSAGGKQFKPEFCGRINTYVVYNPLKIPDLVRIGYQQLRSDALLQYELKLNLISPVVLGMLAFSSNDSPYGVRDLKSRVTDLIPAMLEVIVIDPRFYYRVNAGADGGASFLEKSVLQAEPDEQVLLDLFEEAIKNANELAKRVNRIDKAQIIEALALVRGQDNSLEYIADAVSVWLRRKKVKPLNFFLVGPSGVGKTETAKQITEVLSDFGYEMHRIDCNKLTDKSRVNEIIGSPPGYGGSETEPELFTKHRSNNKLVIVFDEIEKAHPTILTNMMGLLDEGRLNWNNDQRNFCDSIIFFTSNLEMEAVVAAKAALLMHDVHVDDVEFQDAIKNILLPGWDKYSRDEFGVPFNRPDIFGRMQNILVYDPLDSPVVGEIVVNTINRIVENERGCRLHYSDPSIVSTLSAIYKKHIFGARPIIHFIDKELNRAFDKSGIEEDTGDKLNVAVLNEGNDGKVRFKVTIVNSDDNNEQFKLLTGVPLIAADAVQISEENGSGTATTTDVPVD